MDDMQSHQHRECAYTNEACDHGFLSCTPAFLFHSPPLVRLAHLCFRCVDLSEKVFLKLAPPHAHCCLQAVSYLSCLSVNLRPILTVCNASVGKTFLSRKSNWPSPSKKREWPLTPKNLKSFQSWCVCAHPKTSNHSYHGMSVRAHLWVGETKLLRKSGLGPSTRCKYTSNPSPRCGV